jgi:hypothetical protein
MNYEYENWFRNELKTKDIRVLIAVKSLTEKTLQVMNTIKDVNILKKNREMIDILQQQWTMVRRELSCR